MKLSDIPKPALHDPLAAWEKSQERIAELEAALRALVELAQSGLVVMSDAWAARCVEDAEAILSKR